MKTNDFIDSKPDFLKLCEMKQKLDSAITMLNSLANESDTAQRATDLWYQIVEIYKTAKVSLFKEMS